jgi:hypothetical protein
LERGLAPRRRRRRSSNSIHAPQHARPHPPHTHVSKLPPPSLPPTPLPPQLEDAVSPELRAHRYPALDPAAAAAALDRYREVPSQARKQPGWPTKKAADAAARALRGQMAAGGGGGAAGGGAAGGGAGGGGA